MFGILFQWKNVCTRFGEKWFGQRFGIFFHKLIWSLCLPPKLSFALIYSFLPFCKVLSPTNGGDKKVFVVLNEFGNVAQR
jgi:hypothetical protein